VPLQQFAADSQINEGCVVCYVLSVVLNAAKSGIILNCIFWMPLPSHAHLLNLRQILVLLWIRCARCPSYRVKQLRICGMPGVNELHILNYARPTHTPCEIIRRSFLLLNFDFDF